MSIKDFYLLGSKLLSSTIQASPVGLKRQESKNKVHDIYRLLMGDYEDIQLPVKFVQKNGNKWQDILDTGWAGVYLISEKMKSILEDKNLTGWKTFKISVMDKQENEIKGYYGFSITGRCGKIDYSKSEIIEKRLVEEGELCKYYKGLYVGLDQWDGSDFFLSRGYYGIIVSSKAADIIRENKLTNIELANLADLEVDDYTVKIANSKEG